MLNNRKQSFYILAVALIGTILAFLWFYLSTDTSNNRFGLIYTADEPSYFRPAENWLNTGVWKDNFIGNPAYFQRPPGYGIFYLIHSLLYGDKVYLGILISQFVFFFGSIYLFAKSLTQLQLTNRYLFWGAVVSFALLPCFSGFVGYGLTESITPFLLVLSFYLGLLFEDAKKYRWGFIFANAFLIMVRPQLALFTIGFLIFMLIKKQYKSLLLGSLAFLPILVWFVRILIIAPEDFSLHPIYSYSNHTDYRPSHKALTNLARTWEWKSDQFHETVANIKNGRIKKALSAVPESYRKEVKPIFQEYHELHQNRGTYNSTQFLNAELNFENHCNGLKDRLIKENRGVYYFKIPARSAIDMLSKSQMNLNVFQSQWRGNIFVEILRWLSVLLINGSLVLIVLLILRRKMEIISIVAFCILGTLFYYFFIQRLNEARYLVPLLPLILIVATASVSTLLQKK